MSSSTLIEKKSGEKIAVEMKFDAWMATTDTIASITNVTSEVCSGGTSDLVITANSIDGQSVLFFVAGGTEGLRYKILVTIVSSTGEILIGDGILVVKE